MPYTGKKPGRKARFTDEGILYWIEWGADTPDKLLDALDMRSKSTLMTRLRRMRDAGLVTIVERKRCEGFTILSNREGVRA